MPGVFCKLRMKVRVEKGSFENPPLHVVSTNGESAAIVEKLSQARSNLVKKNVPAIVSSEGRQKRRPTSENINISFTSATSSNKSPNNTEIPDTAINEDGGSKNKAEEEMAEKDQTGQGQPANQIQQPQPLSLKARDDEESQGQRRRGGQPGKEQNTQDRPRQVPRQQGQPLKATANPDTTANQLRK